MASFSADKSETMTWPAPAAKAESATMMPIGPAPMTTAVAPGLIWAFVAACMPTANGSTMAPSASETCAGSLKVKAAG